MDDRSKGVLPTSEKHSRLVLDHSVENEMEESYLQYSMSVIVARALPDVRDGLKPVHRRILYVMDKNNPLGLWTATRPLLIATPKPV